MALRLITAPATEPISIDEARDHLRVSDDAQDLVLESMIQAARQQVELLAGRALITQTWRLSLDAFPVGAGKIELSKCPLGDTDAMVVKYVDTAGVTQTLASAAYQVDAESEPARLLPAYGTSWPGTRDVPNAVTVEYVAGYGAASAVPAALRAAMLLIIGDLYENREASVVGVGREDNPAVEALVAPHRLVRI